MFTKATKMTLAATVVAAVLATGASTAKADHYCGSYRYAPSYYAPVYAPPVVYAAPVVSYYQPVTYVQRPVYYPPVYRTYAPAYSHYYRPSGVSFGFGYSGHNGRHHRGHGNYSAGFSYRR